MTVAHFISSSPNYIESHLNQLLVTEWLWHNKGACPIRFTSGEIRVVYCKVAKAAQRPDHISQFRVIISNHLAKLPGCNVNSLTRRLQVCSRFYGIFTLTNQILHLIEPEAILTTGAGRKEFPYWRSLQKLAYIPINCHHWISRVTWFVHSCHICISCTSSSPMTSESHLPHFSGIMALSSMRFSITSLLVHWEDQIDSIPPSCLVLKTNYIHQKQPFTINMFRGLTLFPFISWPWSLSARCGLISNPIFVTSHLWNALSLVK